MEKMVPVAAKCHCNCTFSALRLDHKSVLASPYDWMDSVLAGKDASRDDHVLLGSGDWILLAVVSRALLSRKTAAS